MHDVRLFRNEFYNNSSFYLSPKVISIDLHNVRNDNPHAITHNYTVTDKADGYNMLLFQVGENDTDNRNYYNKIFMIDSNMIVHSTGLVGKSSTGSYILNGEYCLLILNLMYSINMVFSIATYTMVRISACYLSCQRMNQSIHVLIFLKDM